MKVLICEAPQKISIKESQIPEPGGREVLVKIKYCGICVYDLKRYLGLKEVNFPVILGHEPVGIVVDAGKNVKKIYNGEKVVVDVKIKCGRCENCLRGLESRCVKSEASNGFSQYIVIPQDNVYRISTETDLLTATLSEPVACLLHGLKKIKNDGEKLSFLIIGDGIMGILAAFLVKKIKKGIVTLIGHHDNRLKIAEKINIENLINSKKGIPKIGKFDTLIFTVEEREFLANIEDFLNPGGNILFIGELPEGVYKFNFNKIYSNELNFYGSKGYSSGDFKSAVEIIEKYWKFLSGFISKVYSINEIETAFDDLRCRRILKGVLNLENV
ncbi:alcohol dehydrogenase catalytic domain-containing protein [Candidatus Aminicenantes bacterium AC-335-A11]|jgi:2-desacetyl-2-hydroxyethyl bacteriochlorophyllide A dehydrogenase|nr:alcohol dehydrogenase catalytic domain-containing protein [SCandidatus Aminicenantes bacterium Aminicenantia_JdfR_composite]MCP2597239.1 alcohol dehydrogenase catalytic domain-containing protein [Candidatus Aminicenantes bacterium AC-335-G13]MCP2605960.1 alcohol dehydrogenase catalytic domain-containing protein [Candidatus Aminicenantes bacterium AC-708-I09]MCP2618299.1 alcohol dehydrogenase catalytic domain-containing protein [Candidatus Aminicenantes bacterium AC-335-A11]MCP2620404.1 alcoh